MDTKKTEDMKFAKKKKKMSGKSRTFMLITIPIVALFFTFNTLPLIQGAIYSFTNFRGYGSYEWVGFRNYIDLFHDARVGSSYLFTFKLAIVTTIIVNAVSLILAMALNSKIRFKSGLRGLYFLPNILGGLVVFLTISLLIFCHRLQSCSVLRETVCWQVLKRPGLRSQ